MNTSTSSMVQSNLINYLNENFVGSFDHSTFISHFLSKFGVNVKIEDDLFLFKYDQIQVKWNDISKECRGHILTFSEQGWYFVSRPWDKFYNLREGHCPITNYNDFSEFSLVQKADGTAIQVYFYKNKWKVSTLGKITTVTVNQSSTTFETLFLKTLPDSSILSSFDTHYTYLFELATKHNRIVTEYDRDKVFLTGCRHVINGTYLSHSELATISSRFNLTLPISVSCKDNGLTTVEKVLDFVEEQSSNTIFGKNSEGFVVYSYLGIPLAKLKNSRYLCLHGLCSDPLASRNAILELIFEGKIDDVLGDLRQDMQEFVSRVQNWVSDFWNLTLDVIKMVHEQKPQNRREFALLVKGKKCSFLLFKHFETIFQGECLAIEQFNEFLTKNWKVFDVELKALFD
ncbi:hypothetical protein RCL1_004226 [Eukaryota sp. TZLM3-RCL]